MATSGEYSFILPYNFKSFKNNRVNVLECRVCEDVYAFHGDKVPRLLLCGHTLCHSCLLHLPLHDDSILCPFDRQPTPYGDAGVWGLKKNFALLELLERLQSSSEKEALFSAKLLEKERQLAIPCDENEEHIAVLYCTVCSTNLCMECSERTHSTRTLAKHNRVPLSEKPKEKLKCTVHPLHAVEFICLESECQRSPLMCFICKDYGRHLKHSHALLETEAEKTRNQVLNAVQRIQKFLDEVGETSRKLEYVIQHIEGFTQAIQNDTESATHQILGTAEEARTRVRSYFQELRENLNRQEMAAVTVVDAHVRERLCSLKQHQEDMMILLSQAVAMCQQCEIVVQQDDARVMMASHEIRVMLETIENQQQQFADLPDQLQLDPSIPLTFTKDNRVHIGPKIEMKVVTLGLDDAGKTSVLFKLKQNEFVQTIPTIGFNVETVEYNKILKLIIWDVGGQPKLRPLWKHYYLNTQAIIFVVDSSNHDRLPEAQTELTKLLLEKELKDAALLILCNKQDLSNAVSIQDIAELFGLPKLCCSRNWHIEATDAQSGLGLHSGLDWLARQLVAAGVTDVV
ncbi:E3 ubiquitin-protein ligase trim23 [Chamberlinius hualienensis]